MVNSKSNLSLLASFVILISVLLILLFLRRLPPTSLLPPTPTVTPSSFLDEVVIIQPKINDLVTSPLKIHGTALSSWFFEGQLVILLNDDKNNVLANGIGQEDTPGSWTQGGMVSFTSDLKFTTSAKSGYLVIKNDNPSGLPENQKEYRIPIKFSPSTSQFICPKTEWVDCMPGPGPTKAQCQKDFLNWAVANCPGFKGAAL